ncbi:hypothetical protein GGI07_005341 [Coemansia sp. Benny D115]|nr:hypothetical protein GGI07_005341 [Coemansia sp. Benny D115]
MARGFNQGYVLTILATLALTASLLLTGLPTETRDLVFAQTFRQMAAKGSGSGSSLLSQSPQSTVPPMNNTRPISEIVVFGDAGRETMDKQRARLCGGSLWIDHLAEALGADLVSYAHAYQIRQQQQQQQGQPSGVRSGAVHRGGRRVKTMLGDGVPGSIEYQVRAIFGRNSQNDTSSAQHQAPAAAKLYVLLADVGGSSVQERNAARLIKAANELILSSSTQARRILVIDTPIGRGAGSISDGSSNSNNDNDSGKPGALRDSLAVASQLVSDPTIDISVYDARGFLQRMQTEYYKYGLRYPNHPCIYNEARRCTKPDRFFWCDRERVGSKAHYFLADDIVKKHFMSSIPSR